MNLLNAILNPTLQGEQVVFWLWVFRGINVAMPLVHVWQEDNGRYAGNRPPVRGSGRVAGQ